MTYRVIYTDLGTEKIHFPIEMDLKKDNKTMEYTVHIPEQRLRISMEVASDEPIWVGETKWDRAEDPKPSDVRPITGKLKYTLDVENGILTRGIEPEDE